VRSRRGPHLPVERAIDLFLDHCKVERGLSANTLDGYGRDLGKLAGFLADARPGHRRRRHRHRSGRFLAALAAAGLSARSRARALVAIRGLAGSWWPRSGSTPIPAELLDAPRTAPRSPVVLGEDAVARILARPVRTRRAGSATRRCSSSCTPPGCGCRSWSGCRWPTST
jgi:integrase/recombinase XerD